MKGYALDNILDARFPDPLVSIVDMFWTVMHSPEWQGFTEGVEDGKFLVVEDDCSPYAFTYDPRRHAWWHPGDKRWTPA